MSEVAGRMATQVGAQMLTKIEGGMGLLMAHPLACRPLTSLSSAPVPWVSPPPKVCHGHGRSRDHP